MMAPDTVWLDIYKWGTKDAERSVIAYDTSVVLEFVPKVICSRLKEAHVKTLLITHGSPGRTATSILQWHAAISY